MPECVEVAGTGHNAVPRSLDTRTSQLYDWRGDTASLDEYGGGDLRTGVKYKERFDQTLVDPTCPQTVEREP